MAPCAVWRSCEESTCPGVELGDRAGRIVGEIDEGSRGTEDLISRGKGGSTGHVEGGRLGREGRERERQGVGGGVEGNETGCERCAVDGDRDVERRERGRRELDVGSIGDMGPREGSIDEDGDGSAVRGGVGISKQIGADGRGTAQSQQRRRGAACLEKTRRRVPGGGHVVFSTPGRRRVEECPGVHT